jgi:hypothetical protein
MHRFGASGTAEQMQEERVDTSSAGTTGGVRIWVTPRFGGSLTRHTVNAVPGCSPWAGEDSDEGGNRDHDDTSAGVQ